MGLVVSGLPLVPGPPYSIQFMETDIRSTSARSSLG